MSQKRTLVLLSFLSLFVFMLFIFSAGCKKDENPIDNSGAFAVDHSPAATAVSDNDTITISGGTAPYSIQTQPDNTIATLSLSGSTLLVAGVAGGYTTAVLRDAAHATILLDINVGGPITYDIFPNTAGHQYAYSGYAISTAGAQLPDPSHVYQATWTVGPLTPLTDPNLPHATLDCTPLIDTTTLNHPTAGVIGAKRTLIAYKDTSGDISFFQTIGPFLRAFGITSTDTVRRVAIARPHLGLGGSWTALNETFTSGLGAEVKLEIFGQVESGETVTDSSSSHATHNTIRFRTWRRITVNSSVIVDNATTSKLWLEKNVGPVQVLIAQDTENIGHFRVMTQKNF